MELWEKRLNHARAVSDAIYLINGEKLPQHPDGGVCYPPERMFHHYKGRLFFDALENQGHDRACFEDCVCSRGYENELTPNRNSTGGRRFLRVPSLALMLTQCRHGLTRLTKGDES